MLDLDVRHSRTFQGRPVSAFKVCISFEAGFDGLVDSNPSTGSVNVSKDVLKNVLLDTQVNIVKLVWRED